MNATLDAWLNGPVAGNIAYTIAHSLWEAAAVAVLLALLLRMIPARFAGVRYWVSCGALAVIVMCAGVTFGLLQSQNVESKPQPMTQQQAHPALPSQQPSPPQLQPLAASRMISPAFPLGHVVALWIFGVAFFAIWHACGWAWLVTLRRGTMLSEWDPVIKRLSKQLGIGRCVRVLESMRVDGPWVVGLLKPVILVPVGLMNDLSPQQVEAILAHELAHVRRHDYLVNLLQACVETLLFYHPAVWWVSNQIRIERENCCDDVAAEACGSRMVYVEALLALEQRRRGAMGSHLALAAMGGRLAARARRLLSRDQARARRGGKVRSIAVAALALGCVGAAVMLSAMPDEAIGQAATQQVTWFDFVKADPALEKNLSPIQPGDLEAQAEDYKIGPNDLLSVSITDLVGPGVETVKQARVTEKGNISMPMIKEPIKVTGLTEADAQTAIAKAYHDANLLANANVSVTVAEARGRTFSILGQVERPGQYQITQADFRVLDALALSGGRPDQMKELFVIRGKGKDSRVIPIPLDRLASGDIAVNIVVRPNDVLMGPQRERKFVRVTVTGPDQISVGGKKLTWEELDKQITEIPEADRKHTVLELAVATPEMPVSQYFDVESKLLRRVKQYGLEYFSNVGIDRSAATQASARELDVIYNAKGERLNVVKTATRPVGTLALERSDLEEIARQDAAVAESLHKAMELEQELQNLLTSRGREHPRVKEMTKRLEVQAADLQTKVEAWRKAHPATQPSSGGTLELRGGVLSVTGDKVTGTLEPGAAEKTFIILSDGGRLTINTAATQPATTQPAQP